MRKPLIAGNWKMNMTPTEAKTFIANFINQNLDSDIEVAVIPPFVDLEIISREIKGTKIKLGAQNMCWEDNGAYTGEISPLMLKEIGVEYVIIGHSERRGYFKEDDTMLNLKMKACQKHGLKPILCVGETLEEREKGMTLDRIGYELTEDLKDITLKELVIAYEPIWAIGTGKNASPEDAQAVIEYIRKKADELLGIGEDIRILYGGSVKSDNIKGFMAREGIDGALVGGASLKVDEFTRIVNFKEV
ncbi:MAG: triose-phosphate isomerase [Thermoanaerobacteraceae bacterium]|nr:triose-phosphate isomerase [Thermoanaerobacteraceae bacterium]